MTRAPALHTGPLWRAFLVFLLPLMAQNILQSLAMTISAVIVGRTLGTSALASVATFFPVAFFFLAFLIGLSAGASVLVGQAFGGGKIDVVRRIAGTTLTVAAVGGIAVSVLGTLLAPQIMAWLGTPADILDNAIRYARGVFLAMPTLFLFIVGSSLLRGMRDTIRPLIMQGLATAMAAVLTYVLVTRSHIGVAGAAYAQGISQFVAFVMLALWLRWRRHPLARTAGRPLRSGFRDGSRLASLAEGWSCGTEHRILERVGLRQRLSTAAFAALTLGARPYAAAQLTAAPPPRTAAPH